LLIISIISANMNKVFTQFQVWVNVAYGLLKLYGYYDLEFTCIEQNEPDEIGEMKEV